MWSKLLFSRDFELEKIRELPCLFLSSHCFLVGIWKCFLVKIQFDFSKMSFWSKTRLIMLSWNSRDGISEILTCTSFPVKKFWKSEAFKTTSFFGKLWSTVVNQFSVMTYMCLIDVDLNPAIVASDKQSFPIWKIKKITKHNFWCIFW